LQNLAYNPRFYGQSTLVRNSSLPSIREQSLFLAQQTIAKRQLKTSEANRDGY
jgi:hypothetical protein